MKTLLIILILIPQVASAQYFEPFSERDWWLQGVFTGVTVIDWMQTLEFTSDKNDDLKESNPILGEYPSRERVNTLILLGILSHAAVTYFLPVDSRKYWQGFFIAVELKATYVNYKAGVSLSYDY